MPIQSQDSVNLSNVMQQLEAAKDNLRTFRDLPSPTNAQIIQATQLMAKVDIILIRLATNDFSGTT